MSTNIWNKNEFRQFCYEIKHASRHNIKNGSNISKLYNKLSAL